MISLDLAHQAGNPGAYMVFRTVMSGKSKKEGLRGKPGVIINVNAYLPDSHFVRSMQKAEILAPKSRFRAVKHVATTTRLSYSLGKTVTSTPSQLRVRVRLSNKEIRKILLEILAPVGYWRAVPLNPARQKFRKPGQTDGQSRST